MFILFCNCYLKKHNMRNVDNSEPCLESQQLLTALKILQYFRHITGAPPRRPKRICLKQIFSACLTTLYRDLAKGIISVYLPREAQKTAMFYFCNIFIKPISILIIFGTHILQEICYHLYISHFS